MVLPQGFDDLEQWVADWAIGEEAARNRKRLASSLGQLQGYYDALLPRMDAIISHLNQHALDALPPAEQRLLELALMFMEVAPAVEIYKSPDVLWGFDAGRFHILPA